MWSSAPEIDETDDVLEHQMRSYSRQIEECELAKAIPHWDGYSGLVRVCDEDLAQALQKASHPSMDGEPRGEVEAQDAALLPSPFAAPSSGTVAGPHRPASGTPLDVLLATAQRLLSSGKTAAAAAALRSVLASVPLERVSVVETALDLLLQAQGWEPPSQDKTSPRQSTALQRDMQNALAALARCEPRRALLMLQKAEVGLEEGTPQSWEAARSGLLRSCIQARHHV